MVLFLLFCLCAFLTVADGAFTMINYAVSIRLVESDRSFGGGLWQPPFSIGTTTLLIFAVVALLVVALFAGVFLWQRRDAGRIRLMLAYLALWFAGTLLIARYSWWPPWNPEVLRVIQ